MVDGGMGLVIRDIASDRIVDVLRGEPSELEHWLDEAGPLLCNTYRLELIDGDYPVGLVGRNERFPDGHVVAIPPIPRDARPSKQTRRVTTDKMSPVPVVNYLIEHGPEICIIAGELHHRVYSPEFRDALFEQLARARKVAGGGQLPYKAQIACGPVAMTPNGGESGIEQSILGELVEHPDVELFYSHRRQKDHFRLAPFAVYTEGWHPVNAIERRGTVYRYRVEEHIEYQEKRLAILSDDKQVTLCKDLADVDKYFIFMTENELGMIVDQLASEGKDAAAFDDLDREGITDYMARAGIEH